MRNGFCGPNMISQSSGNHGFLRRIIAWNSDIHRWFSLACVTCCMFCNNKTSVTNKTGRDNFGCILHWNLAQNIITFPHEFAPGWYSFRSAEHCEWGPVQKSMCVTELSLHRHHDEQSLLSQEYFTNEAQYGVHNYWANIHTEKWRCYLPDDL